MAFVTEITFEIKNDYVPQAQDRVHGQCQKWIESTRKAFPATAEERCKLFLESRGRFSIDILDYIPHKENRVQNYQITVGEKILARIQITAYPSEGKWYCSQTVAFQDSCDDLPTLYRHCFSLFSYLGDPQDLQNIKVRLRRDSITDIIPTIPWMITYALCMEDKRKIRTAPDEDEEQSPEPTDFSREAQKKIAEREDKLKEAEKKVEGLEKSLSETAKNLNKTKEQIGNIEKNNAEYKQKNKGLQQEIHELKKQIALQKTSHENEIKKIEQKAKEEKDDYCKTFDPEIKKLKEENQQLYNDKATLEGKLKNVKGKLGKSNINTEGITLAYPAEEEKYDQEYTIAIMSALHAALASAGKKTGSQHIRSRDVWQAFISANPEFQKTFGEYGQRVTALLNAMKSNDFDISDKRLKFFNIESGTHTNNHGKIEFRNDERYQACTASTPSETASGPSNFASYFKNAFLFPHSDATEQNSESTRRK